MQKLTDQVIERIRDLRLARRWSQEKLAEEAGLSRDAISRIERGDREPRLETLKLIAEALDLKLSTLLDFEVSARPSQERDAQLRSVERSLDLVDPRIAEALITAIRVIAQAEAKVSGEAMREPELPHARERGMEYGKRPRKKKGKRRRGR